MGLETEILNELKTIVDINKIQDIYDNWEIFHLFISNINQNNINDDVMNEIIDLFRHACGVTHEVICRNVLKNKTDPERKEYCPLKNVCSGCNDGLYTSGHLNYCKISEACVNKDINTLKEKLNNINDDSLKELKTIRDNW